MLRLENVCVDYGAVRAVRGVSIEVPAGAVVGLLGANGAGKTSVLRAVSGQVRATSGSIEFGGRNLQNDSPEVRALAGIGHIPEGRGIFPGLKVRECLRIACRGQAPETEREVLELFPVLETRLDQAAGTMSGGEQQMLATGMALARHPKVLLIDELSMGLAPKVVEELFNVLSEQKARGMSILIVEQYVALALALCDEVYVLQKGVVAVRGPAATLQQHELEAAYLGTAIDAAEVAAGDVVRARTSPQRASARLDVTLTPRELRAFARLASDLGRDPSQMLQEYIEGLAHPAQNGGAPAAGGVPSDGPPVPPARRRRSTSRGSTQRK